LRDYIIYGLENFLFHRFRKWHRYAAVDGTFAAFIAAFAEYSQRRNVTEIVVAISGDDDAL
jgi:hypothetical protein